MENVNIRSIVDLKTYEQQLFKKEDGWNEYVVHVMENDVGKLMYYQDLLQALATLFSSSQIVFRFHIHPTTPNNSQTYSTPNLTQWWLIKLNKHLLETKAKSCFPRFYVPNTNKQGYFSPNENFATFKHRMYGNRYIQMSIYLMVKSIFNLVKIHAMSHYVDSICKFKALLNIVQIFMDNCISLL